MTAVAVGLGRAVPQFSTGDHPTQKPTRCAPPPAWLPVPVAARLAGVETSSMYQAVIRGGVAGRRDRTLGWLVERRSLAAYKGHVAATRAAQDAGRGSVDRTPTRRRYLPAEPLLRLVAAAGGPGAVGAGKGTAAETALLRARRSGWLTLETADTLAIRLLNRHPMEIWGDAVLA